MSDAAVRGESWTPQRVVTGTVPRATTIPRETVERRRAERACYLSPVRVLRGVRAFDGTSRDISASGLLVTLPADALAEGHVVVLRFALPVSGSIVSVRAIAVRVTTSRTGGLEVGLQMAQVPEEAQTEIARFVAALASPDRAGG